MNAPAGYISWEDAALDGLPSEFDFITKISDTEYDFELTGELYRIQLDRKVVIGPDGAEYDLTFFEEEWLDSKSVLLLIEGASATW